MPSTPPSANQERNSNSKAEQPTKYIFVTGGVVSSIGKGITTASLGRLLRNRGFGGFKLLSQLDDLRGKGGVGALSRL